MEGVRSFKNLAAQIKSINKDLESKDINLTNEASRLSKEKQNIAAYNQIRLPQIEEDQNIARYAMDNAKTEGDENLFLREYAKLEYEKNNLANPDDLNVDIGDALDQRDQVRRELAANKALGAKYKLNVDKQSRPFYELDEEGKIKPETVELRSERPLKTTEPKGGGGRKVSAYNPNDQGLSTIGIYGIERANYPTASPTARPTQLVGRVKGPQTQKPTAAMRGQSGTRTVNIAENIRHLSDPNWLASQGYNLNEVSPQQLVGEYLQRLQNKTGSADLQEYLKTRGRKN